MIELTVIAGSDKGRTYQSSADETVLGRDATAGVSLSDRSISRRHARIVRRGRSYEIEDLHSGNGTIVNAEVLVQPRPLALGDLIMVGKTTLRFHQRDEPGEYNLSGSEYLSSATITMRDLQRELSSRTPVFAGYDEVERARNDMAAIYRSGQSLFGLQTTEELFARIIDVVLAEIPRADRCSLLLVEEGTGAPVQFSRARDSQVNVTDIGDPQSVARIAMQQQQAMLISDPMTDERLRNRDTVLARRIRSALCVPIQTQSGMNGAIYADAISDAAGFDEADLRLLSIIGLQAVAAIDNTRLYERLHREKAALAEANQTIRRAQEQLVQSEKLAAVGQLAAGIVHDVRNPMQIILSHAQMTLDALQVDSCSKDELIDSFTEIEKGVMHVNEIVSNLLVFARQTTPSFGLVTLASIATETLAFLRPQIAKAKVEVVTAWAPQPFDVYADTNQIKQVIINVVINALQAMPSGGTLTVSTRHEREGDHRWEVLSIQDTGVGMTREQRGKIFDPFYTTKTAGKGPGGTGLGLSVSYGIIENHGGQIRVESEPGKGSTFVILLPTKEAGAS